VSVVAQAVEGSIVTGSIYGTANLGALAQSTDDGVYALTIWRPADPVSTESGGQDFVTAIRPKLKERRLGLDVERRRPVANDHYPYKNWYLYPVVGTTTTLVDTLTASPS
jgi:branched-chain amino acid transport system substrate-binding protein